MPPRSPSWMVSVYYFFPIFFTLQLSALNFTCYSVTPPFCLWVSLAVFSQLLLQLPSIIFCQKALPYWSSHLLLIINGFRSRVLLKTTLVTLTPSLKWWLLLIPHLYFITVNDLLNHSKGFLGFFKSMMSSVMNKVLKTHYIIMIKSSWSLCSQSSFKTLMSLCALLPSKEFITLSRNISIWTSLLTSCLIIFTTSTIRIIGYLF